MLLIDCSVHLNLIICDLVEWFKIQKFIKAFSISKYIGIYDSGVLWAKPKFCFDKMVGCHI